MSITLFKTRFWTDTYRGSFSIQSSNGKTRPLEAWISKHWKLPGLKVYCTGSEDDYSEVRLSAEFLWFGINLFLRFTGKPPQMEENRAWGFYFMDRTNFVMRWGKIYKSFDLPFVSLVFVKHELLTKHNLEPCLDFKNKWKDISKGHNAEYDQCVEKEKLQSTDYPYRYELLNGEVQNITATVHAERWTHRWKWTPFKRVRNSIDVKFSDEVGPERGSWKGGCIGCSYTMRPGENILTTLRRMERERRFER